MRGLYLVLLTVLLCFAYALSLQCHFCNDVESKFVCQNSSCGPGDKVCFKSKLTVTLNGQDINLHPGGCAPSCQAASSSLQVVVHSLQSQLGPLGVKAKAEDPSCCEQDLCNGVARAGRSLWALAGGLLLSVGPTLLWALL